MNLLMPVRRVNNCASGLGRVKDAGARQNVAGWGCECAAKRKKHSDVLCFLRPDEIVFYSLTQRTDKPIDR